MSKDLHDAIMNIQNGAEFANFEGHPNTRIAYKTGHRDARHAAAELALSCTAGAAKGGNTSDNITQAAANKAAEEGGLPALPKAKMLVGQHLDSLHVLYSAEQVRDAQRAAIAADRASRQVANKAHWGYCPECGSTDSEEPRNGMGHFCNNCGQEWHADIDYTNTVQANLARGAASQHPASKLGKKLVANKAEVDLSSLQRYEESNGEGGGVYKDVRGPFIKLDDVKALLATPPANKAEVEPWYMTRLHDMGTVYKADGTMVAQTYGACAKAFMDAHNASFATPPATTGASTALADMEARKDAAYYERNQVVSALAKCFPSGVAKTAIEGWSEDWHGCVYIDLPAGQASWHFHDSHAHLFDGLPAYAGGWDGHSTDEKYARLAALKPVGASAVLTDERIDATMLKYSTFTTPGAYSLTSFECVEDMRSFAREVAAQAGQVAVPEAPKTVEADEWSFSTDEENYRDPEPTRAAIIQHALSEIVPDEDNPEATVFWIGKNSLFVPDIEASWVIEQLQEQAYDECGEWAETFLEDVTDAEELELKSMINDWAARVDRSNFWTVGSVEKFTIESAREELAAIENAAAPSPAKESK